MIAVPHAAPALPGTQSAAQVRGYTWLFVPLFWLAAAVPAGGLGMALAAVGAGVPVLAPRLAPLLLLTSCFFQSTMAVGATVLYGLRAWWVAVFLAWLLLVRRAGVERRVWAWIVAVAALLAWGTLVASVRLGDVSLDSRSPVFEASVAFLWVLCLAVGWAWLRPTQGRLSRQELTAIGAAWAIAIGYGVKQGVLGVNELTVPPDIWPELEGFQQYEDLGRHPFASRTANGMAAVSILPVALLFAASRRSLLGTATVLALAVLVGVLTLTRSYLMLLAILVLLLVPLQRTRVLVWIAVLVIAVAAAVSVLRAIDPELLALSLRLEGDVTSLRADIWSYTLATLEPADWLVGMGYGTGVWERFFAPMGLLKELQSPHNAVLEIVGQFGLAGLLVYGAIGATVIAAYLANRREPVVAAVALAAALVMARELLAASYIFSPSILGTYFWTVFGMVLAQVPSRAMRTAATR